MVNDLTSISILIGLFYSFILSKKNKTNLFLFLGTLLAGCGIGLTVFLIKINNPKATNLAIIRYHRYMILAITLCSLIALLVTIIRSLLAKGKESNLLRQLSKVSYLLVILTSLAMIMPTIFLYTTEFVYFGEDTISSMMLMRVIGFTLGLALVYLISLSMAKVASALTPAQRDRILMLALLIQVIDYAVRSVTTLQRLKWIPLSDLVFQIMIFGDNQGKYFLFAFLALLVGSAAFVIFKNRKVTGEFKNPALKRKERAKLRNRRRWGIGLLTQAVTVFLIVTVVHYYDTKEVELTPPQDYQTEGDYIIIPLEDIADGHLHRFSYHTPNGFDVRFIAVKKPQGTTYGLGLDACDICGVAGYYERGDDVICKRCDVVMNKNTIGFYGGCNPVPFPYEIKDAKVFINKRDLEKEEMRFR